MVPAALKRTIERVPSVARGLRGLRDALDRHAPALRTPWGFTLAGHPSMAKGTFEPAETALIRELLAEVDVFINVGANVGYYVCHAASLGKRVVAVEPLARNLHYLLRNVHENGWSEQVEIFPLAMGAGPGVLALFGGGTAASLIDGWAGTPSSYSRLVPVNSLDALLAARPQRPTLVLVDVEGAELMVLDGARALLEAAPRPSWLIEIVARVHQPAGSSLNPVFAETFRRFFDAGYSAQAVTESGLVPWTARDVQRVCDGAEQTSHNYLFRVAA